MFVFGAIRKMHVSESGRCVGGVWYIVSGDDSKTKGYAVSQVYRIPFLYSLCKRFHKDNILLSDYSFCCTTISVNVSMMSPSRVSLKLTRLIPHSNPVGTSFTSSC